LDLLISSLIELCPEGERLFPEDMMTGETERFFVQEIVREKIIEVRTRKSHMHVLLL
jgi:GTPase Era involved in 16S rRNA processing